MRRFKVLTAARIARVASRLRPGPAAVTSERTCSWLGIDGSRQSFNSKNRSSEPAQQRHELHRHRSGRAAGRTRSRRGSVAVEGGRGHADGLLGAHDSRTRPRAGIDRRGIISNSPATRTREAARPWAEHAARRQRSASTTPRSHTRQDGTAAASRRRRAGERHAPRAPRAPSDVECRRRRECAECDEPAHPDREGQHSGKPQREHPVIIIERLMATPRPTIAWLPWSGAAFARARTEGSRCCCRSRRPGAATATRWIARASPTPAWWRVVDASIRRRSGSMPIAGPTSASATASAAGRPRRS